MILGIIFTPQSKTVVGQPSSFMYSNPERKLNGYIIIAIGLTSIVGGVITTQYSKKG